MSRYVIEPVKEFPVRRRRSSGLTNALPRQGYRRRRRHCRRPKNDESTSRHRGDACESVRHGRGGSESVRQRREVDGPGRRRRKVPPSGVHGRRDASETKVCRLDDSESGKRHQNDGQSESQRRDDGEPGQHRRDDDSESEQRDPVDGESWPHHLADGEPRVRGQDDGRDDSESEVHNRDGGESVEHGGELDTTVSAESFDRISSSSSTSSTARPATSSSSHPSASRHRTRRQRSTTFRHRCRSFSRRLSVGRRRQLDPRHRPTSGSSSTFSQHITVARTVVADDGNGMPAVRCSANVVLLAHGYRSLHVLVVQRSQLTASDVVVGRGRVRPSPSAVVVRYKL